MSARPVRRRAGRPAGCRCAATALGRLLILLLMLACAVVPGLIAPYDPNAFDYRRAAASRRAWRIRSAPTISAATSSPARSGRRGSTCRSRCSATLFPAIFGTLVGCLVGYAGGCARRGVPPPRRRRRDHPAPGAGDRHRRRARPRPAQHVHRDQRGELDRLRPAHARRDHRRRSGATMPPPAG